MPAEDVLLDNLTAALFESSDGFSSSLPAIEKQMYEKVIGLASKLEKSNGRLKVSVNNIRILGEIKRELTSVVMTDKYRKSVKKFAESFDAIQDLQTKYFDAVVGGYKASSIMSALKKETVDSVLSNLLDAGVNYNITQKIADELRIQVISGGKYSDLVEGIRTTMLGDGEGVLQRYAKTYATDALYTYSRQYNQVFSEDLGIEWYRWWGGLKDSSRDFCVAMEENTRKGGCLEYIHVSQFDELLKGQICGGNVVLNKKTDLPQGFKKNTTTVNFTSNAGGWNCQHQLIPTPTIAVPDKFIKKIKPT